MLAQSQQAGIDVLRMPSQLFEGGGDAEQFIGEWTQEVCAALDRGKTVVTAIGRELADDPNAPQRLAGLLVRHVKRVLRRHRVEHLYVEGGRVASMLIRSLGCREMSVCAELAPGVVSLQVEHYHEMIVTMKPGSYGWPPALAPAASG